MPEPASSFSERGFHEWARRNLPAGGQGLLPLGDDAAAVRIGGRVALLTTDAMVEGTHFLPGSPPDAVGAAVAAASLSDIAAKGGTPVALLLALLVPGSTPTRWPRQVALGAERMMARFGGHLVGGDTKWAPQRCVIGTALGIGNPYHLAPRTGARPGDLLVTTGTVGGGGAAGLALRPGRKPRAVELLRLLTIAPRVREGRSLVRYAHAMLDTSDGLAQAAHLMADASGVRVVIEESKIPWDPDLIRQVPGTADRHSVGFFGGDYELFAAVPPRLLAESVRAVHRSGTKLTVVGRVTRGHGAYLVEGREVTPLPRSGWDPFQPTAP